MSIDEVYELNLNIDNNGKIVDDYGNEYRDESGQCHYIDSLTIKDMM